MQLFNKETDQSSLIKRLHCLPLYLHLFDGDSLQHGVQGRVISVDNFFCIFEIIIFCFLVATCDLVHDVETIFHLSYLLTTSGNLF